MTAVTFSRIYGRSRIGADFLRRIGVQGEGIVVGQVDSLEDLRHADFDPDRLSPLVRHFFEHTARVSNGVSTGMALPVFGGRSRHVEVDTLAGPVQPPQHATRARLPYRPRAGIDDGRKRPHAWIRTYTDNGDTAYVAVHAIRTMRAGPIRR